MPHILASKKDQEIRDRKLVQKIKPKLREFVINHQVQVAAETARKKATDITDLLSDTDVINRASKLACNAFFNTRVWHLYPPPVEMKWLTRGAGTPELVREMNTDIAGFASYLVREYKTFRSAGVFKRGYPNPLSDDNIVFFWNKFCADLKMLIDTDRRLVALGNKGVVVVGDPRKKGVVS